MEILEYKRFLAALSEDDFKDYLYELDIRTLTDEERLELEFYIATMRREKVLAYIGVLGFLLLISAALIEQGKRDRAAELIKELKITKPDKPKDDLGPYDWVWVTNDPCQECAFMEGARWGIDTELAPKLHPHCKCKYVKIYRKQKMEVKAMKLGFTDAGTIRAVLDGGKRYLEVLAGPFGSPDRKDKLGQYLTSNTDFMLEIGDRRPTLYFHGFSPRARAMDRPAPIGVAEVIRIDPKGLWMRTSLDDSELANRTWEAALKGEARASTGSVNYLERHNELTGEVEVWPIAELSVFDSGDKRIPVSDDAVVLPLRSLYDHCDLQLPKGFEAGEDKDRGDDEGKKQSKRSVGVDKMDEILVKKAVQDALEAERAGVAADEERKKLMREEIIKDLEGDPQYRGIFNVNKIVNGKGKPITDEDAKRGVTKESREEGDAFLWQLMHPTQAPAAMRVLEESEALEGGPMVPIDMLNKIIEIKGPMSLVNKIGLHRYKTNSLVFNFPTETAAMGALAAIAEEGAYVANEPAFATVAATLIKYGSMVTVTEEMAADQNLFEPYFVKAVAKAWALAENLTLYTELDVLATSTQGQHSATFTDVEIMAWFFSVLDEWADGGHIIMNRATMGTMRALLIGTPRAYGAFPDFGGGDIPSFMGVPVHTNGNWLLAGSGDENLVLTYVHPDAVGWVENGELTIKVDPYGDSANGRIRYFPRCRFETEVLQALGNVTYTDHA